MHHGCSCLYVYIVYVYICIYMQEKNLEGHDPLLIVVASWSRAEGGSWRDWYGRTW